MIQVQTILDVVDNSGAKKIQCIKVLGGSKRKTAGIGDVIVVSVKKTSPNSAVKKGSVRKALIVRTKKQLHRLDGSNIKFHSNCGVLVNSQLNMVGTRIFGPVPSELKKSKVVKVLSLAEGIV